MPQYQFGGLTIQARRRSAITLKKFIEDSSAGKI